jgi:hypothetical protein
MATMNDRAIKAYQYHGHTIELRRSPWPNELVKHYYGFVDGRLVRHSSGYGWVCGFDAGKLEAELKRAVDSGDFHIY